MDDVFSGGVSGAIMREAGSEPFDAAQAFLTSLPEGEQEFPYAHAIAMPSGNLRERGINHVVFVNIFPPKKRQITVNSLGDCVASGILAAESSGDVSFATAALQSGSFGELSLQDSCQAVLEGVRKFATTDPSKDKQMKKISLILYYRYTPENAMAVVEMLKEIANKYPSRQLPEPGEGWTDANVFQPKGKRVFTGGVIAE